MSLAIAKSIKSNDICELWPSIINNFFLFGLNLQCSTNFSRNHETKLASSIQPDGLTEYSAFTGPHMHHSAYKCNPLNKISGPKDSPTPLEVDNTVCETFALFPHNFLAFFNSLWHNMRHFPNNYTYLIKVIMISSYG